MPRSIVSIATCYSYRLQRVAKQKRLEYFSFHYYDFFFIIIIWNATNEHTTHAHTQHLSAHLWWKLQISLQHQHCHNAKRLMSNVCQALWPVWLRPVLAVSISNYCCFIVFCCIVLFVILCARFSVAMKNSHVYSERIMYRRTVHSMEMHFKWHIHIDAAATRRKTLLTISLFVNDSIFAFRALGHRPIKNQFSYCTCLKSWPGEKTSI